ncbi:thiamine pyrophosphate-dependent enzyme [Desulfotalea psychrophila]|uniref:Probable 2-oxoacid ferredoxin oxidoreductase, beta subunit n=1 Tax=Desulfotalea psychrophila (strain LSv54 / DSM 12343) TaxID=177439 RepID=Q6ALE4_DESPS|nr:thiamine pyrophosphate-dependent enzyme [Desulfotalea psychrophila]CAG36831.1 probable 2-oxoacid ferredoxin oxidoreductase, beta subunit [Desulfotalea psychrophila LSv54]
MKDLFDLQPDISWCPGCGNFAIRKIILEILKEIEMERQEVIFVSGIGQAAKAPQFYNASYFNGLHGRSLPAATGIKAAQPETHVIVESGDGDMYGEGGNHFIHAIRRNPNITVLVHDNMVYGLTKGQASPTSLYGMVTPAQVTGVAATPLNPLALAISLDASFVARTSMHKPELSKEIIKEAIAHDGMAIVDIFQACVTFNKTNTYKWYVENTAELAEDHDWSNQAVAFAKSLETDPYPLGIIYKNMNKTPFEKSHRLYHDATTPLYKRRISEETMQSLFAKYQ